MASDDSGGSRTLDAAVFEHAGVGLVAVTGDGTMSRVNTVFRRIVGFGEAVLEGRAFLDLTHPDDREAEAALWSSLRSGAADSIGYEKRCRRSDGSVAYVSVRVRTLPPADGFPGGEALATVADLTERRRLEARNRELARIVENSEDFIGICGTDLRARYVNPAGRRMVGLPPDADVIEVDVLNYFHPDERERILDEAVPAIQRDGRWLGETRFRHFVSGETIHTLWNVSTVLDDDGDIEGYVTTSPDLTALRHSQRDLRKRTRELLEANRRMDRFLSVLGHELRNPMNALQSAIDVATDNDDETSVRTMRAIMRRQVDQLASLIDDLVDVARAQHGRLEVRRRPQELGALLEKAVGDRAAAMGEGRVALVLERVTAAEAWADVDPPRLLQVIDNLITNAIRASAPGTSVIVAIDSDDDEHLIEVRDCGKGIEPEHLKLIFRPFESIDGRSAGLGLGLAIAREICAAHGGSLEAMSDGPGRGACFRVRLPACERPPTRPSALVRAKLPPLRLVLIDDHADSLDAWRRLLERAGHETYVAGSGLEGIERVRSIAPDAVICDIGLPDIDGYEVARQLTALEDAAPVLIGLSGFAGPSASERSETAGFDRYLEKPITVAALLDAIGEALAARDGATRSPRVDAPPPEP